MQRWMPSIRIEQCHLNVPCLASVYLALVITLRIDSILFPGNEFTVPSFQPAISIPGTDKADPVDVRVKGRGHKV